MTGHRTLAAAMLLTASTAHAEVPGPTELRDAVDGERLTTDLRVLTGEDSVPGNEGEVFLRTRNIHHPDHRLAGAFIEARLEAIAGVEVHREVFDAEGEDDLFNVVGELPGTDPDLPPVILGAHYDSIASLTDGWDARTDPAPGADDDASGVAAVLECARVLAAWPGGARRTVRFALFSAEEYGLVGAYEHVRLLLERGEGVDLMLSLDPIGYDPGGSSTVWVPFTEDEPAADRMAELAGAQGGRLTVTTIDADLIGGDARSDHYPFWAADLPALHVASFPQPPTYHTVEDALEVVDPTFHREVTALVLALAADRAQLLPETDEDVECSGCSAATTSTRGGALLLALAAFGRRRR